MELRVVKCSHLHVKMTINEIPRKCTFKMKIYQWMENVFVIMSFNTLCYCHVFSRLKISSVIGLVINFKFVTDEYWCNYVINVLRYLTLCVILFVVEQNFCKLIRIHVLFDLKQEAQLLWTRDRFRDNWDEWARSEVRANVINTEAGRQFRWGLMWAILRRGGSLGEG